MVKSDKCTAGLWEGEEGGEQSLASSGALILQGCQDDRWRMGTKEGKRSVQEGGKPEYTPKSHPKENPTRRPVAGGEGLGSSVHTPAGAPGPHQQSNQLLSEMVLRPGAVATAYQEIFASHLGHHTRLDAAQAGAPDSSSWLHCRAKGMHFSHLAYHSMGPWMW